MNKISILKNAIAAAALIFTFGVTTGCIEETFPEGGTASTEQIQESPAAKRGLLNAVVNYINAFNSYGNDLYTDFGYSSFGIMRDEMCEDFYVYNSGYDNFREYGLCTDLANNGLTNSHYYYYYKFLNNVNSLLSNIDLATADATVKQYAGIGYVFRAMIYMDMSRAYEYKKTGIAKLDNEATTKKVYGLTVPIVTEKTTETEARNNPRAPFYTMYKFIMDDLNNAEKLLADYTREAKNMPNLAVIYGLKARLWLDIATRFEKYPADLATLTQHVDLGANTAAAAYAKAAEYARKAIEGSGATPLTELDWYGGRSYVAGFNSIRTASWMWGSIMNEANVQSSWINFTGYMSTEQTFGVANTDYLAIRMISKALFEQIPDADWRKATWVDPADTGKAPGTKYHTLLTVDNFKKLPPYTSLKFKPNEGNMVDYKIGAAADCPLMRVEEMYFIEAEALAAGQGVAAGVTALENFMKTYRYDSYKCAATTLDDFRKELMLQKRIEFWGEGIIFWDYKRLELKVTRGYSGTNCIRGYRLNSLEGYCAPWFNVYFSRYESDLNTAVVLNPDPSSAVSDWTGQ